MLPVLEHVVAVLEHDVAVLEYDVADSFCLALPPSLFQSSIYIQEI